MNVLVLGSGGREHAITVKLKESKKVNNLYVMPGNPGTDLIAKNIAGNPLNNREVLVFCLSNNINIVIPGSEVYLQNGIADALNTHNIYVFGPTAEAAQIESSKEFAKKLMRKYNIPTADYEVFDEYNEALKYLEKKGVPIVIKYDGLAGGKGVVVAKEFNQAKQALYDMLESKIFGNSKIIIEEYLEGPEFSLMCFVDNGIVVPMPISQDHKRLLDGDKGPNTGGMGIYSGVPIIPESEVEKAVENIMKKTVKGMEKDGIKYTGFLYGGLMYTKTGTKVIEFNSRFGDPEAEVILPKMESDLIDIIVDLKNEKHPKIKWSKDYILGVVLASKGYPKSYEKGVLIKGLKDISNYYHMGTKSINRAVFTNGGRVLFVYGRGKTLEEAKRNAYNDINKIKCDNLIYRKDIGYKSL